MFSQYDRAEIDKGVLAGKGLEICWIKNPVDAFFAQIQGSTRVKLADGELLRLNYIASNGKPYTPVGRLMIDDGLCTPEEMSMDKIREYMETNPKAGEALRLKNRSYVFFSETQLKPNDEPLGAQGIPLTPGRSLAVDPSIHVYGTPIWIDAKFPLTSDVPKDTFQHLMFAQDTGSAIRGAARADIYFGHGEDIPHIAGRIKQFGKFVMLVPKDVAVKGTAPKKLNVPLPRPRPKAIVADILPAQTAAQRKPASHERGQPPPRSLQRGTCAVGDVHQGDRAVARERGLRRGRRRDPACADGGAAWHRRAVAARAAKARSAACAPCTAWPPHEARRRARQARD